MIRNVRNIPTQSAQMPFTKRTVGGCAYCGGMSDEANRSKNTNTNSTTETLGGPRPDPANPASKDPSEWVTGDEPMTGPQRSYLDTLAREAGEELPADLSKAEASENIDRLQDATGRGSGSA